MKQKPWHNKISNHVQLGGIETSVLDNGAGRGTRIAWINTGTGLRYKVVIDRAMDIAEAFYNQHSLTWISHLGVSAPEPFSHHGADWLKTFGGGLLTTCGLSHVGPPEHDENGERGLHGTISNTAAEIEAISQPDPANGKMEMSISGRIKQTKIFGPSLELRRTISGTLGKAEIKIKDEVINRANTATPLMLLYHFNFGWPLIDEGTDILWKGSWKSSAKEPKIFKEGSNFRKASPPIDLHSGSGEEVAFIDPVADEAGECFCGFHNQRLRLALTLRFPKSQLPWLTNWQHWGSGEYVTGLEPGTNPPTGQSKAREQNQLIMIQPGEKKSYDVTLEILDNENSITEFLKKHQF